MQEQNHLMRVSEVANELGLSVKRVYELVARDVIPHIRVDGGIRIPEKAWNEWHNDLAEKALANAKGKK